MVVESTDDDLTRADEAERQVIETLRQMETVKEFGGYLNR